MRFVVLALALAFAVSPTTIAHQGLQTMQGDPKQWVMPNGNYSGWNYSALDQINLTNVQNLTMAWSFQLGILDAHEASPLVIGDTMYIVTPKPNYVYALDLTRDGVIKWEFRPEMPQMEAAIKAACCGAQTRGLAYADGKIFYSTLDGQVFALNAENGKVVWRAENANLAHRRNRERHAAHRGRQSDHRRDGWRKRRPRPHHRLQHRDRQHALALLQHGAEQRSRHRPALQAVLRDDQAAQSRARLLVWRLLEARRRLDLGLVHLRSGAESLLLRHQQLRAVESGLSPGVGKIDLDDEGAA